MTTCAQLAMAVLGIKWDHMHGVKLRKTLRYPYLRLQAQSMDIDTTALRTESTHILACIALLCRIEKFVTNKSITVPIYTDCKRLINGILPNNINSPLMVLSDHVDLSYQIRQLIESSSIQFDITCTQKIKNDDFNLATSSEKLAQPMHLKAYGYFTTHEAIT